MDDELKKHRERLHERHSENPFYLEGFNSGLSLDENPYKLDVELNLKVNRIAAKKTLSEEDKKELERLKNQLDETPYSAWSYGSYIAEEYQFLKL